MLDLSGVKNIIFDLGAVVLNIDYTLTIKAFQDLGAGSFDEVYGQFKQSGLFDDLETGRIEPEVFRDRVREEFKLELSDDQIDRAWNALLLDLPKERIDLLRRLGKTYRLFLLSNTNAIHYKQYCLNLMEEHGIPNLDPLFEKVYLSHEIHARKPSMGAYQFVVDDALIVPEESIFIDDIEKNALAAEQLGIRGIWLRGELLDLYEKAK
jgi:putative hydrolase of the HAD superfamily